MPYIMLQKIWNVLVKLRKTFSYTTFYFLAHAFLPTPIVGKNSLHCCVFLYDHCFRNVLCIVLNKFYCILFRRWFNLIFKKQSEKLKHYEGEHCKNWRRTEGHHHHDDRTGSECFPCRWPEINNVETQSFESNSGSPQGDCLSGTKEVFLGGALFNIYFEYLK